MTKQRMKRCFLGVVMAAIFASTAQGNTLEDKTITHAPMDGVIRVFGPGGPHTAFIRAGKAFEAQTGKRVEVVFGPESKWSKDAQKGADIIFGSSEQSMTAFLETYRFVDSEMVEPLYIRRTVIVVQKGNPKNIRGVSDLLLPGRRIIVTEGKGVYNTSGTGVWEDVAGRLGALDQVKQFRENIASFEKGSGASFRAFKKLNADAWITWIHWPLNHNDEVDYVEVEEERRIYRVTNIVVSPASDPGTEEFVAFLKSEKGAEIFASEGMVR